MKKVSKIPLVSVVIPVYNVEPYLKRCLDTVVNQSYSNLQIILVDDGSTDNSGNICDEYCKNDKRIEVIHKKNGGLSDARNAGIEIIKGSFVTFIDSDDWVDLRMIEDMSNVAQEAGVDVVTCEVKKVKTATLHNNKKYDGGYNIVNKNDYLKRYFKIVGNDTLYYAPAKLYKRELIKKNQYPKGLTSEDVLGTYRVLKKTKIIAEIKYPFYFYYQNSSSITGSVFSGKDFDLLKIWDLVVKEADPRDREDAIYNRARIDYTLLMRMAMQLSYNEIMSMYGKQSERMLKDLKSNKAVLLNSSLPLSRKITLRMIISNYKLFVFACGARRAFSKNA